MTSISEKRKYHFLVKVLILYLLPFCAAKTKLIALCDHDCDRDTDCQDGLWCAEEHKLDLLLSGYNMNQANCTVSRSQLLISEVCFDPIILRNNKRTNKNKMLDVIFGGRGGDRQASRGGGGEDKVKLPIRESNILRCKLRHGIQSICSKNSPIKISKNMPKKTSPNNPAKRPIKRPNGAESGPNKNSKNNNKKNPKDSKPIGSCSKKDHNGKCSKLTKPHILKKIRLCQNKFDCDLDSDCEAGLWCSQQHRANLKASGFHPLYANCRGGTGNKDVCFNPKCISKPGGAGGGKSAKVKHVMTSSFILFPEKSLFVLEIPLTTYLSFFIQILC
jgi:hypothetical protein